MTLSDSSRAWRDWMLFCALLYAGGLLLHDAMLRDMAVGGAVALLGGGAAGRWLVGRDARGVFTVRVDRLVAGLVLLALGLLAAIVATWGGTTTGETCRLGAAYVGVAWLAAWARGRR